MGVVIEIFVKHPGGPTRNKGADMPRVREWAVLVRIILVKVKDIKIRRGTIIGQRKDRAYNCEGDGMHKAMVGQQQQAGWNHGLAMRWNAQGHGWPAGYDIGTSSHSQYYTTSRYLE
jgi:hypothetical protein